jgi:hypothetical protein
MTLKWELQFIAIIVLSGGLGGCAGKLRESDGTVHDNRFAVKQATAMTLHAPLVIPFVPLGEASFAVEAVEENGKIELSGVVVGEERSTCYDPTGESLGDDDASRKVEG